MRNIRKPAEWEQQGAVLIAWPNIQSDWRFNLHEIVSVYRALTATVSEHQPLYILCREALAVKAAIGKVKLSNIHFVEIPFNDTWVRDYGPFVIYENEKPVLLDYQFNGWGGKFNAELDDRITTELYDRGYFNTDVRYKDRLDFVLEGGAVETDGNGLMMATVQSILSTGRNAFCGIETVEVRLKNDMGISRIHWLQHGGLEGDDTGGHIDMLARFCDAGTICYVGCDDEQDGHFQELARMEADLINIRSADGHAFRLLRLPMAKPVIDKTGKRLPASYANFLIMNEIVLMPLYGGHADDLAREVLSEAFPGRKIVGIQAVPLIQQGGSIHCATIQFPEGIL